MSEMPTKVAAQAIDALKGQPFLLAMLIFNALFIGVVYFSVNKNADRHQSLVTELIEKCLTRGDR